MATRRFCQSYHISVTLSVAGVKEGDDVGTGKAMVAVRSPSPTPPLSYTLAEVSTMPPGLAGDQPSSWPRVLRGSVQPSLVPTQALVTLPKILYSV